MLHLLEPLTMLKEKAQCRPTRANILVSKRLVVTHAVQEALCISGYPGIRRLVVLAVPGERPVMLVECDD